ncbi:SPOR domain-containing protein [Isoptericola croceus]|uniref:SPOR domain-containing protein n=1 Tax=Isoptericola croceus TaxID=3031406 RepID=UPI0023F7B83A|nr:SPOR domain-containing protein [Isoptericola croceus]
MSENSPRQRQYWYNADTGEVVEARQKPAWTHRMGPYPTREAAERALDTAAQRNENWEDDDAEWRGQD